MSSSVPPTQPAPGLKSALRGCCLLGWVASAFLLALLILFVLTKDANYTSVSPWVLSLVFVPTGCAGLGAFWFRGSRLVAFLACLFAIAGMGYLYYLDQSGRMISYTEMIWRRNHGMRP